MGVMAATASAMRPEDQLELLVARLCDELELERKLQRRCRAATLFRLPGEPKESYREVRAPFTPALKARILAKHPKAEFINRDFATRGLSGLAGAARRPSSRGQER